MEKSIENKNYNFLKEGLKVTISKHHKEYLGTTVPEGYFLQSKTSILKNCKETAEAAVQKAPKKPFVFRVQPQFRYVAAASLVCILSLTIWLQSSQNQELDQNQTTLLSFSEDVLINSLFVADAEVDLFADATLVNEIIIKAELSEQKMDNLFLNSLFVEDSLIDDYTSDKFLETIIL